MLVCSFVSANRTRDRGCSKHPVFPAPSDKEGGKLIANLGQIMPRDRGCIFSRHSGARAKKARPQVRNCAPGDDGWSERGRFPTQPFNFAIEAMSTFKFLVALRRSMVRPNCPR